MRDIWSLIPFRRAGAGEKLSYQPSTSLPHMADLTMMADAQVDEPMGEPDEVTIESVRAEWAALFERQEELLDIATEQLLRHQEIERAARGFLELLDLRSAGNKPLFSLNDAAATDEVEALRHALVTLQAVIAGAPLPLCVAVGRVTH